MLVPEDYNSQIALVGGPLLLHALKATAFCMCFAVFHWLKGWFCTSVLIM